MSQKFLHVLPAPDRERAVQQHLEAAGFRVLPSQRMSGGLQVRVREDTPDQAEVERIVEAVAPGTSYGPSGAPVNDVKDYRKGR